MEGLLVAQTISFHIFIQTQQTHIELKHQDWVFCKEDRRDLCLMQLNLSGEKVIKQKESKRGIK